MNCDEFKSRLPALLRGDLSPRERREALAHVEECTRCRQLFEQEKLVESALRGMPRAPVPPSLRPAILRRTLARQPSPVVRFFPRWAPAVAAVALIFLAMWFVHRGGQPLEATYLYVEVLSPQEDEAVLADDATILAAIFPSREYDITLELDEEDITSDARIGKGFVLLTLSSLAEGYHELNLTVRDTASGQVRKTRRVFYAVREKP